jgi:NTE family protein
MEEYDSSASLLAEIDVAATREIFSRWADNSEIIQDIRAEIGAMALAARTAAEDRLVAVFQERIGETVWPERPLLVTAVDCQSGEFKVWDRNSNVPLHLAVASSCAVPGLFPPVTINGRRYTDGGVRSGTSADLSSGYDAVLIVAPIGAGKGGIDPLLGSQASAEAEALRAAGTAVELVFPDAAALEEMGPNRMDASRRGVAAEAGVAQGKTLAVRLKNVWANVAARGTAA